jgi:hypothetical protein
MRSNVDLNVDNDNELRYLSHGAPHWTLILHQRVDLSINVTRLKHYTLRFNKTVYPHAPIVKPWGLLDADPEK